jgi:diguanylate cyclase (GGDEF)-like protein
MEEDTRVTAVRPQLSPSGNPEEACLVLIYPPGPSLGRRFPIGDKEVVLGRGADCDVLLDRDAVSRRHARIERLERNGASGSGGEGGWRVVDLGSTNGTYVNDVPVQERALRDGDRVKIGNTIFKFLMGGNVESAYHEEIYRMTIVDGLTQIYNKRYFLEHLDRELARCGRSRRPLSLVMFDIDHFKRINDDHGHLTGDHILRELASRVKRRVRRDEVFARYGGEEFAVVLPEAGHENAVSYGEKLRRLVESEPFAFEQEKIPVTVSVGVATVFEEVPAATFIKAADDCLYRAKRNGRNQVVG